MAAMRTMRAPGRSGAASDEEWYDYVYLRDNPRGPHRELWQHHARLPAVARGACATR